MNRTTQALLFLAATLPAPSQQPTASRPSRRFEIASIKPSRAGAAIQDMRITFPPGRMEAVNITLNEMLSSFTGFSGKVEGGPKWVESERYDIVAKADGEITLTERGPMVMALLEDRFKLTIHHEAKEERGIALVKGSRPPDLEPAKDGEGTLIRLDEQRRVIFRKVSMSALASYLRSMWSITVVDHTGIVGNFDFSLDPDSFASDKDEAFRDRLRSAVEAFGFRLEPLKVSRDITIIDHIERPTEN